jgi:predicted  nucleic acid-binding Zn-ribbon protein
MGEVWKQVETHIIEKGCPECGDHKLSLEFLCDVDSADCFFLVRCEDNGHYCRITQKGIQFLFQ